MEARGVGAGWSGRSSHLRPFHVFLHSFVLSKFLQLLVYDCPRFCQSFLGPIPLPSNPDPEIPLPYVEIAFGNVVAPFQFNLDPLVRPICPRLARLRGPRRDLERKTN